MEQVVSTKDYQLRSVKIQLQVTKYVAGRLLVWWLHSRQLPGTLFLASWKDHLLGRNKYIPNCLWCGKATP